PPVAHEAGRDVLGEGDVGVTFDGDVVVVVDPAQVVELEVAGQGGRLGRHAFHHAAAAAHRVDVVVEDVEAGPVVAIGQPFLGDGHAHAGSHALAEGARGRLHPGHEVILGMTRGLAADLAKAANVVQGHRGLAQPLVVRV